MFDQLQPVPTDPILGLVAQYKADNNPKKIDLSVGVYKDEIGNTPVLKAVKEAESHRLANEQSKAYLGIAGNQNFNDLITKLIFGEHQIIESGRVKTAQTPGGTGALRVAAEFIKRANPSATIWATDPTWANHHAIFNAAGLETKSFPYFDFETMGLKFDEMIATLSEIPAGDVVLFHACCHNPSGLDLTIEQWQAVADVAKQQGFTFLIDSAYQGFGDGLEQDAAGIRLLANQVEEMLICSSCSKNFGLYRERIGAVSLIGKDAVKTEIAFSNIVSTIRAIYSMPPAHGADIVATILGSAELTELWHKELDEKRERINGLRSFIASKFAEKGVPGDFNFIAQQKGMFSFLGIDKAAIETLKKDYSIYIVGSSRVNVAGVNESNADYLAESLATVLSK